MKDLLTVGKKDPDFSKYLLGTFAKDKRALPVSSLNVRSETESVTFRIVSLSQLNRPAWPVVWAKTLRPAAFLQVLVPLFLILTMEQGAGRLASYPRVVLTVLAVLVLHAAVLLRNDVDDHVGGIDRLRKDRGSRAIQNGWLTAATLNKVSLLFLVIAFFIAAPLFWWEPRLLLYLAATSALGGIAFFWRDHSYRDFPGGSFMVCVMGGPLLSTGAQMSLSGAINQQGLFVGLVWGLLLFFPLQLRNFEYLLVQKQTGRSTWVGRIGFDRSTGWLQLLWVLGYAAFISYHWRYGAPIAAWFFTFVVGAVSVPGLVQLRRLSSPAGSAVPAARRRGETLFYLLVLIWVLEVLWRFPW